MGTPSCCTGQGLTVTEFRSKCRPEKSTVSPRPRDLIIWTISSMRLARRRAETPAAFHSSSWSALKAPPTPAAIISLPWEIRSTVPRVWARSTGWRRAISSTEVPRRTRLVRAATAARAVSGSSRGLAVRLSPTHRESNPASSALQAKSIIRSAFPGRSSAKSRPRVGSRKPIFGFLFLVVVESDCAWVTFASQTGKFGQGLAEGVLWGVSRSSRPGSLCWKNSRSSVMSRSKPSPSL